MLYRRALRWTRVRTLVCRAKLLKLRNMPYRRMAEVEVNPVILNFQRSLQVNDQLHTDWRLSYRETSTQHPLKRKLNGFQSRSDRVVKINIAGLTEKTESLKPSHNFIPSVWSRIYNFIFRYLKLDLRCRPNNVYRHKYSPSFKCLQSPQVICNLTVKFRSGLMKQPSARPSVLRSVITWLCGWQVRSKLNEPLQCKWQAVHCAVWRRFGSKFNIRHLLTGCYLDINEVSRECMLIIFICRTPTEEQIRPWKTKKSLYDIVYPNAL
jgi:hypothetical protein